MIGQRFIVVMLLFAGGAASADPFGAEWPAGPNRELTGAFCGSCHALALVTQQRFDRRGWDDLLDWMIKTQNMPDVDPSIRSLMLDYLVSSFGLENGRLRPADALLRAPGGLQGIDATPLLPAVETSR